MGMQNKNNLMYSEVYEILCVLGIDFSKRIPKELYELIETNRNPEYVQEFIREDGTLDEEKISKEGIALFSLLNIKYFMDDENEKNRILKQIKINEENYQKELREKYNIDDLFKNKTISEETQTSEETTMITVKEERWYKKIFNLIKNFLIAK